jgi:sulfur carrier protein
MRINVNGEPRVVAEGVTLQELVPRVPGFAVAVNGVVVAPTAWESTRLSEDDAVEVVTAHQGG